MHKKLSPSQRTEIIKLFNSGIRQYIIAKQFKVSQQAIMYVIYPEKLRHNKVLQKTKPYDAEKQRVRYQRYVNKKKLMNKK